VKVSDKHFATFKAACSKWLALLNLGDWQVYFQKKPMRDYFAETSWNLKGRVATITLNANWNSSLRALTNDTLGESALHECLHLCMAELRGLATARYITEVEVEEREEATVVRVQHAILGYPSWRKP